MTDRPTLPPELVPADASDLAPARLKGLRLSPQAVAALLRRLAVRRLVTSRLPQEVAG